MEGQTVSHYKVLERLGGGGMGVVYKALDTRLDRHVALKFLPPELTRDDAARARFTQEAKSASALDHPNICTIHDIDSTPDGQLFIAMGFYEGETLKKRIERGPLPVEEAVDLAIQVARGLAKAHAAGIIHRDIKSANLMATADDSVKILDFGLAKLAGSEGITQTGTTLGTVGYMSPEQAGGNPLDHRSDLWSLGVVLYEIVAGRRPFGGESPQSAIYAILNSAPAPLHTLRQGVSTELARVVSRALTKPLDGRYQSAVELLQDLQRVKDALERNARIADAAEALPSIAVLPFADMSPQKDQDYFCEGMAEEVINALTKIEGIRVVARTSAFQFKGQAQDVRRIGEQLGVKTVLQGSVRTAGTRLRVMAQLINVADGCHLWSERYDRTMEDVFDIQDEISQAIAETLKVKLLGGEAVGRAERYTYNLDAYNLYLQGRHYWFGRYQGSLQQAISCFELALAEDPSYASAHAGLAQSYAILTLYGFSPPQVAVPKAQAAANHAVSLAPNLADAHAAVGMVSCVNWEWSASEDALRRALELDPRHGLAHSWLCVLFYVTGRAQEAIAQVKLAEELDPLSSYVHGVKGLALYSARKFELGVQSSQRALAIEPNSGLALFALGLNCSALSRRTEAVDAFERAVTLSGRASYFLGLLGYEYGRCERHDKARQVLQELLDRSDHGHVEPLGLALAHVGAGALDEALESLEKAVTAHGGGLLVHLKAFEVVDALRPDPRFAELLRRMNFPETAASS